MDKVKITDARKECKLCRAHLPVWRIFVCGGRILAEEDGR